MITPPSIIPQIPIAVPAPIALEPVKPTETENQARKEGDSDKPADQGTSHSAEPKQAQQLNQEEQAEVRELQQRDREVRAHEAAHKAAAGRYARGGAEFEYQRGPDGQQYAVGGEVSIDASKPNDPQQALQKSEVIRRAAMAPAHPSSQDRAVAAQASQMAAEARAEIREEKQTDADSFPSAEAVNKAYAQNEPDIATRIDTTA